MGASMSANSCLRFVVRDKVVEIFQRQRGAGGGRERKSGLGKRGDAHHGHFLKISAVVSRGLQSIQCKLRGNIFGGDLASALAHAAAFQQITGEEFHMRANSLRIDERFAFLVRLRAQDKRRPQAPKFPPLLPLISA